MWKSHGSFDKYNNLFRLFCYVFCSFLLVDNCVTIDLCDGILIVKDKVAWKEAKVVCQKHNGSLLNPEKKTIKELSSCPGNFQNSWIDKYAYFSQWIEIIGCHSITNNLTKVSKRSKKIIKNEPGTCAEYCSDVKYFGLKEEHCYCFNPEVWNSLTNTQQTRCNVSCYKDHYLSCGGSSLKTISVYRIVKTFDVHHTQGKKNYLCATLNCQTIGGVDNVKLYSGSCRDEYANLCSDETAYTVTNWIGAIENCKNKNAIPYPAESKNTFCSNRVRAAWSGVFRNVLIGSLSSDNKFTENRFNCSKLIQTNSGYGEVKTNCDVLNSVVCVKNNEHSASLSENAQFTTIVATKTSEETNISNKTSDDTRQSFNIGTSHIIGIVIGLVFVLILVFIVVLVLVKKSKRHSKPNISDVEFQERPQNAYHGPNINDTQSGDNSRGFHNNYDVVAEPIDNGHPSGDNIAASYKLIEGKNDDMVYTDTLEGEYDTFNNRDKRKIKMQNENNHLYSHTNVEGNAKSDYDTMQAVVENDTDTYDHSCFSTNDNTARQDLCNEENHYDLTQS